MTNDISLKGFWPPEAKGAVNLGYKKQLIFFSFYRKIKLIKMIEN